jgi:hypothetical protein
MPHYIDFSWKADGSRPLATTELEIWESIIREAMGGPGWVVMRQVHGTWQVEEARVAGPQLHGVAEEDADRRNAVRDALRRHGKTVGG